MLEIMPTLKRSTGVRWFLAVVVALVSVTLSACIMDVEYARPGQAFVPHEGKALVFSRIRFFYDGRELFPWKSSSLAGVLFGSDRSEARHVWLRRLDVAAVSWELRPDNDGSLTIWLPAGDYALFGSEDDPTAGATPTLAVVALLRVPADQPAVYAGELVFADEFREGWHAHYIFGSGSVTTDSTAAATRTVEARYGALPGPPAVSAWCAGRNVPSGNFNSEFVSQSRQLLDAGCSASP
jgi:hypothetical protein